MTRTSRATPHLFADWERLARQVRRSKHLVIFLDFDGTIAQIAPTPDRACLENATRDILRRLARHRSVTVVVISGRRRAELQSRVRLRRLKYLGLYGWETDGRKSMPMQVRLDLAGILLDLHKDVQSHSGVRIEPKENSFSVHLLEASAATKRQVRQQVNRRLTPLRQTLKVVENLRDIEVAPVLIGDKGEAVRKVLAEPVRCRALPVYFGDDLSDEPAFAAARKGISILVGKRRATRAKYFVRGPAEVTAALSKMEELIQWRERKRPLNSLRSPI